MATKITDLRRRQNVVKAAISALNIYHESAPTIQSKCYFEGGDFHVKGHFWRDAVIIGEQLNLTSSIVEKDHVRFF